MRIRPLLIALAALLLLPACNKEAAFQRPGSEFVPYVQAFTAGHISARAPVLVRFNEGVALKDTSDAALQQLFQLDPKTDGVVRWEDAHTLAFQPRERLKQATNYTVTFRLGKIADVPASVQYMKFGFAHLRAEHRPAHQRPAKP
jgi:hypothetical protein